MLAVLSSGTEVVVLCAVAVLIVLALLRVFGERPRREDRDGGPDR